MRDTAGARTGSVLKRLKRNDFKEMCAGQAIVLNAGTEAPVERQLRRGGRATPMLSYNSSGHFHRGQAT
jgi:hypothetical protein